jgi:hypothetical protein
VPHPVRARHAHSLLFRLPLTRVVLLSSPLLSSLSSALIQESFAKQCELQHKRLVNTVLADMDSRPSFRQKEYDLLDSLDSAWERELESDSGRGLEKWEWVRKQLALLRHLLTPDLVDLAPAAPEHVRAIFRALDRGEKGYLSVEEFAWLSQLQTDKHVSFRAACSVLARRASPVALAKLTPEERATVESKLTQPTDVLLLNLPHELGLGGVEIRTSSVVSTPSPSDWESKFLVADECMHELQAITRSEAMRPMHFLQLSQPMQQEAARRWYSLRHLVDYMRIFHADQIRQMSNQFNGRSVSDSPLLALLPTNGAEGVTSAFSLNGCTAADFESYIARRVVINPALACEWLARAARVLNGDESHPTKQMWLKRALTTASTTIDNKQ